jgi:SAM-dependent methyltransferase
MTRRFFGDFSSIWQNYFTQLLYPVALFEGYCKYMALHSEIQKSAVKADIMLEIRLNEIDSDEESRLAYEGIYRETDIALRDSFYLWLLNLLALQPDDVYLDVSCGHGQLTKLAWQQGVNAHGLDLSQTAIGSGCPAVEHQLVVGNSQWLPYADGTFSVVSNIGSIEHYVAMDTAVQEMARVLRPNGRAIILLPNTFSLMHNIWTAFREGRTFIDSQPIQRYAAKREWQQLLEENGLVVDRIIKYEIERPATWPDFLSYLYHPKRLMKWLLTPFIPLNLAFCFVYICHKPE